MNSKKLEETALWKIYEKKDENSGKRKEWVKEIYEAAVKYLLDVRGDFKNYTLHDETHVLNVMDAIGGLLGDQIGNLSLGELELLILASCLHDVGMVYTDEERRQWFADDGACSDFLKRYYPELLGCQPEAWAEDIQQRYLRTLHPFRIAEVVQNESWRNLFSQCPLEIVPRRCILAVCQAHGQEPEELQNNKDLEYLQAHDTDPLFCALLLRLGDLLDFDDTRAPEVLYGYVGNREKSHEEWDKHRASAGFRYYDTPSSDELPFMARCINPGIEHAVRDFLDWIDEELGNCIKLRRYCRPGWRQTFSFPRAVMRNGIESDGYMSGDFCLTMDQEQILRLLTGENIYDNRDVFIREMLQNAIDATLLRGKMDPAFVPENSRIDLWEWNDKDGNIWFRIDDHGIGMTLGMLQRYFLKVGNSYYTSKELERDLIEHGQARDYHAISCFGIGFLSCFLSGDYVEVSTLYFDPKKNKREEAFTVSGQMQRYGLRLQVTGLSGYYTLKNQAKQNPADERFPGPDFFSRIKGVDDIERSGYRIKPGTSIAIRLDPGKLGALDLCKVAKKCLCGSRVPVYYNNKRIGLTYEEIMEVVHEIGGENVYELSSQEKQEFDAYFPSIKGQYPKLVLTVVPLDTKENQTLPGISGALFKYDVLFDKETEWRVKDQTYKIEARTNMYPPGNDREIRLWSFNESHRYMEYSEKWHQLKNHFESEKVAALEKKFVKLAVCPITGDQIGDEWTPFAGYMEPGMAWRAYYDFQQERELTFSITDFEIKGFKRLFADETPKEVLCIYQGITAGDIMWRMYGKINYNFVAIILLENDCKPRMAISRSGISDLPLKVWTAFYGIIVKYHLLDSERMYGVGIRGKNRSLKEWREVREMQLGSWLNENLEDFFRERMQELKSPVDYKNYNPYVDTFANYNYEYILIYEYFLAQLQDNWEMAVNHEKGQIISFYEKKKKTRDELDLFPPMMFCRAASDQSRQYICNAEIPWRRAVTSDHPFIAWLLDNAFILNKYYKRQLDQIIDSLRWEPPEKIIEVCNDIREQMISLHDCHGLDVGSFPQLGLADFWFNWHDQSVVG